MYVPGYCCSCVYLSCEIEDFVEASVCKLCVILRSRVLAVKYANYSVVVEGRVLCDMCVWVPP